MKIKENDSLSINVTEKPHELGLYIHIPFCVKKCDYCDFLSAPADEETRRRYVEALLREIRGYNVLAQDYLVSTIFIGGGTPSCLKASYIEEIMNTIHEIFRVDENRLEATIEINPGTITREKLLSYQRARINRLSFGLQSADNQELKLLGRIHTYEQLIDNYHMAREIGFTNINIDLMSALPGQTLSSWESTLNRVIALRPEHISAYSLIIEEGTPFYERYGEGKEWEKMLPEEEEDRAIYHRTKELLLANGYERYEISNYSLKGYECRHNSFYWTGVEYLGIGLGASSYLQQYSSSNHADTVPGMQRFKVTDNLEEYIHLCNTDTTYLYKEKLIVSVSEQMEEFMYLGLRMCRGINVEEFANRFYMNIEEKYKTVINQLLQDQLLVKKGPWLRLTEYGIDISNKVLAEFLIEDE